MLEPRPQKDNVGNLLRASGLALGAKGGRPSVGTGQILKATPRATRETGCFRLLESGIP